LLPLLLPLQPCGRHPLLLLLLRVRLQGRKQLPHVQLQRQMCTQLLQP
jgi:hypothetical protein